MTALSVANLVSLETTGQITFFSEHDVWQYHVVSDDRLCPLCDMLKDMVFRGDTLAARFPYLVIDNENRLDAHNHMPRDDNCRCYLTREAYFP